VGRVWDCILCTCVSEEGGDGEGADSEALSLLSYKLRYVSLVELGNVCQVGLREPMHFCERGGWRRGGSRGGWGLISGNSGIAVFRTAVIRYQGMISSFFLGID
jgi:hypothetical protein